MDVATQQEERRVEPDPYAVTDDAAREREPVELLPWLPCTLALDIPVIKFTVSTLLGLTRGSLIESAWHQSTDIPMRVNGLLMAWTEFEVVGERLAARITDLV